MKKKHSQTKKATLDRKLVVLFFVALLVSFFVRGGTLTQGSVFGVATDLFEKPTIREEPIAVPKPALYPKKSTDAPPPPVTAKSAIVIDVDSQVVLYERDQDIPFPPASTTKIMTALVGIDSFALSDVITVPSLSINGARMGLLSGEQITFENLLYGLLLASGNDAAETITRAAPVGYEGFIAAMNEKASELSLLHTHFEDPTGLSFENYTTALDLARLASFALKNTVLANIVSTKEKTVSDITGEHIHKLENLNKLLGTVRGVIGMKTGFTEEAGQVLVTAATRDTHTIVTVVLRSEDRFLDSRNLLEWAFANHTFTQATVP